MATLEALSIRFATQERPAGNLLDAPSVLAQAIAAVSFYAGFAEIRSRVVIPPATVPEITGITEINESEWALIRPLFMLFVERETALQLEASRGLGMDVYGRASSEIASDITMLESELPHRAFCREIVTV